MNAEQKKVAGIMGAWAVLAIILFTLAPDNLKWLGYVPAAFIVLAFVFSAVGLLLQKTRFFKPNYAQVKGRKYEACQFCPEATVKDNPVNKNYPVYKCKAKEMRTLYDPRKVPGWCPYAIK